MNNFKFFKTEYALHILDLKEEISPGDKFVSLTDKRLSSLEDMPYTCRDKTHASNLKIRGEWAKVIASTDSSLGLISIPSELAKRLLK